MKLIHGFDKKVTAGLLMGVLLVAVLVNNLWERSNVQDLDRSFSSIYDDRLIPATYIFKLTDHLYRKRLLWADAERPDQAEKVRAELIKHDAAIDSLVKGFEATYLVEAESKALQELETRLATGQKLEAQWLARSSPELRSAMTEEFDQALIQLDQLSQIQEHVGKDLKKGSRSLLASSLSAYQFEISLMILVFLLLLAVAFGPKSLEPSSKPGDPRLN